MCDLNSLWFFLRNTPTHMRPPASSRNPGLQMHLKLPSSLMQSPLRHMFLIRHSSMSVNEHKEIDRLTAVHLDIKSQSFVYFTSSLSRTYMSVYIRLTWSLEWQAKILLGTFKDAHKLENPKLAAKSLHWQATCAVRKSSPEDKH